jgi:hypothetical protein
VVRVTLLSFFFCHRKGFLSLVSFREGKAAADNPRFVFIFFRQLLMRPQTYIATQRPTTDAMYYSDYSTSSGSLSMSGSGSSLSYSKGTSKNTAKKGGIRGMLDSLNSHIAPGIVKNV